MGDFKDFSSGQTTAPLDGNAVGGEAVIGTFLSSQWSIEFDLGVSRTTTDTASLVQSPLATGTLPASGNPVVGGPRSSGVIPPATGSVTGNAAVPTRLSSSVTNRPLTGSTLVGYHPRPIGRVEFGFLGGVAFVHLTRDSLSSAASGSPNPLALFVSQPQRRVDNVPGVVMGIEARLPLDDHWAVVSSFRATAFALGNGEPGGFFFRPGVGVRWSH
jgi:hypothetical protein